MSWNDFNTADDQQSFDLIPKGTLAKVRMTIRPGGFDDETQGWTGGYATQSDSTGAVYLNCEFVVLDGPYAKRKVWSLIGLESPKGPEWASMGRAFIKTMLNSSRGIQPQDTSPQAQQARRIRGFAELDGCEFVARIDTEKDIDGETKNIIKTAITAEHKDYAALMQLTAVNKATASSSSPGAMTKSPVPTGRPSWAQ